MNTPRLFAVVTGASSGIGFELAKLCAEHDYDLLVAADDPSIHQAAQTLRTFGASVTAVEVDLATRQITTPGGSHQLTPTEARLLQVLAASVDRVIPTDELLDRVWTDADGADPSYLWVTVRRLRRKLEADPDRPRYLLTERGIGYRLSSGSAASQRA